MKGVVQKQRKLRIQFTLIVINIHCFLFALKKKTMLQFTEDFKHCWTVQLSDL